MVTVTTATYHVRATRWDRGWELHVSDMGVTQAATLERADRAVRDYLATLLDVDDIDDEVVITPELGGLEIEAAAARQAVAEAGHLQKEAAARSRETAHRLRSAGLSVGDTAMILGISRGRVSQLSSHSAGDAGRVTEELDR